MAGFLFRLETTDGKPADPPTLSAAVPNWSVGDSIYFGHRRCGSWAVATTTPSSRPSWSLRSWPE